MSTRRENTLPNFQRNTALQKNMIWDFSFRVAKGTTRGTFYPSFLRFSAMNNLLCIKVRMKEFTFGILSGFQNFFHNRIFVARSVESLLYPYLTVYYPFFPQPMRSLEASFVGVMPCRDEKRRFLASSKWTGGWNSFQPIQHPFEFHNERSWRVWIPKLQAHSANSTIPGSKVREGYPRMLLSQTLIFLPLPQIQY